MSDKPLHFGESDEPDLARIAASSGEAGYHIDANYIPGYTEQVMANDISKAVRTPEGGGFGEQTKQEYYRRFGCEPKPLPVHITWIRATGTDGGPSFNANTRQAEWTRLGYRPVTKDDFKPDGLLGKLGYKPPPAAQLTPDGHYRNWDSEAWVVDGDRYRQNQARKEQEKNILETGSPMPDRFAGKEGEAPTFELERKQYSKPLEYTPKL